jgi:hypothetical protein
MARPAAAVKRTVLAGIILFLVSVLPAAASHKLVSFDVPGAVLTYATAINAGGQVAGTYLGQDSLYHGFVRESNGTITTFDVSGQTLSMSVVEINAAGQIAGYAYAAYIFSFSFIRESDGTITTVAVPYSGTTDTLIFGINDSGEVCGLYFLSASDSDYGFVRNLSGGFTTLHASSITQAINNLGETTGGIAGGRYGYAFVEDQYGNKTQFNPPGSTATIAQAINRSGQVAGYYLDASGIDYGFLRNPDGTILTFAAPGSGTGTFDGTYVRAMNDLGQIAGYTILNSGAYHAFVRDRAGNFTVFNAPNAGTCAYTGTQAISINASGTIAGYYTDTNGIAHGFLRY